MKKISTLLAVATIATVSLSSCTQADETRRDNSIGYKIESHEALTDDDYTRMIMYVGEYAEKAQKYVDDLVNDQNAAEAQSELDNLGKEYPLVDIFRNCIRHTPLSKFNADNMELLQKYGHLMEFTMPAGMSLVTDPKAAGMIVETPAPDADNGVIAGAVDEEKVVDK